MSGTTLTITLSADPALRDLAAMLRALRQPERALRDIGEALLLSTDRRFRAQVSPEGRPWAKLSPVTLERRLDSRAGTRTKKGAVSAKGKRLLSGAKILRDSGALQDTMAYQIRGGDTLLVGTNRIYGATHQFGAKMGQFGRYSQLWRRKAYSPGDFRREAGTKKGFPIPWGDIPARPFLGLSGADRNQIRAILKRHITRGT